MRVVHEFSKPQCSGNLSRFGVGFKLIVHTYNLLFIISNGLNWPLKAIGLVVYGWVMMLSWGAVARGRLSGRYYVGLLILACVGLGFLVNGPDTVPNWDYYKYNYLIDGISRTLFHPGVVWSTDGQWHALAYYYAIFLPTTYLSAGLSFFTTVTPFSKQVIFISINCLVGAYLIFDTGNQHRRPWIWLCLLGGLIGLDGVVTLVIDRGFHLTNDIQNGGGHWFFSSLRIQDFLHYFFWLPGHTLAALVALSVVLRLEGSVAWSDRWFICVPVLLFLCATSIFATLAFFAIYVLYYWTGRITIRPSIPEGIASGVLMAMMGGFYAYNRQVSGFSTFVSLHMRVIPIWKWVLFLGQELVPFAIVGWWVKPPKEYWIVCIGIAGVSLIASRDLLMSGGILAVLVMVSDAARAYRTQDSRLWWVLLPLTLPTHIYLGVAVVDAAGEYPNRMTKAQVLGSEIEILPSVISGYIRR